jgi:hypothetical protein
MAWQAYERAVVIEIKRMRREDLDLEDGLLSFYFRA